MTQEERKNQFINDGMAILLYGATEKFGTEDIGEILANQERLMRVIKNFYGEGPISDRHLNKIESKIKVQLKNRELDPQFSDFYLAKVKELRAYGKDPLKYKILRLKSDLVLYEILDDFESCLETHNKILKLEKE